MSNTNPPTNPTDISVTAVIATHNRHEELRLLLMDLLRESHQYQPLEVLVVDSKLGADPTHVVEEARSQGLDVTMSVADNVLAAKRNHGARTANGDLLIFLDDDLRLRDGFIRGHVEAHAAQNKLVSGQVLFPEGWVRSSNYYKYKASRHMSDQSQRDVDRIPGHRFVAMNCSIRRDRYIEVGGFEERFVRYGGEDVEFGYRAHRSGLHLAYAPDAAAYHYEVKMDVVQFAEKNYQAGYNATPLVLELSPEARGIATYRWTERGLAHSITDRVVASAVRTLNYMHVSVPITHVLRKLDARPGASKLSTPLYKALNILSIGQGAEDRGSGRVARSTQYRRLMVRMNRPSIE